MARSSSVERTFEPTRHGWRRLRPTRPHEQVAVVLTAFLVVGVIFAATTQARLADVRNNASRADMVNPVLETFGRWEREQLQLASGLVDNASGSPAERGEFLEDAGRTYPSIQLLWSAYSQVSLDTPVEQRLQDEYSDASEVFTDLGLAILARPDQATNDQLSEVAAAFETLSERIQALREYYEDELARAVAATARRSEAIEMLHAWGTGIVIVVLVLLAVVVVRSLRQSDKGTAARAFRTDLETRLQRGLEMAHDEDNVYPVVERAIALSTKRRPAEMLVADSSRAHFQQVAMVDHDQGWSGCPVAAPAECPAAARGQTQVFNSSADLDACPYLSDRPYGPCSAACVPLSIAGKTVGVIHTTGPDKSPHESETVATLELVARKAGERVAMLRAFSQSQSQAHTDALTGLLNRRSLEDRVHELDRNSQRYVVAYADLDRFKMLNDVHGHDIGDRALRLFARVLRDSVRPNDIPARYGGEEFVVVLPDCDISDAFTVAERVHARLAASLDSAHLPTFTVSVGLAGYEPSMSFTEMVERADQALLVAKQSGRNRTVVASAVDVEPTGVESVDT